MKFYYFHLMPYPMEHDEPSSWVTLSNRHYDPAVGHTLYNQYLDQLEYAEQLGWDGLCVNEHHQNCYGTMPSPNVMAAMLVRRTIRAKIAILGNGLPLRENPLRIAEEIAMLDVASGGRVISGFVRGISAEYFSTAVNPTHSRERFYEAAELILRAWTEEGPFPFDGRFYRYPVRQPVAAAAPEAPSARVVSVPGQQRDGRVGGQATLPVPDGLHADHPHRPDLRRVPRGVRAPRLHRQPLPAHRQSAHRRGRERREGPRDSRRPTRCGSITWGSGWRRPSGGRPATSPSRRCGACSTTRPRCPPS